MKWRNRIGVVVVCVALVASYAVRGNAPTISSGDVYATGTRPVALATGDLNHDGVTDLVALNNGSNTASVFVGDASGGFHLASSTGVVARPVALAVADLNGDAKPDLITVGSANGNINFRFGNGAGAFPTSSTYQSSSTRFLALAVGDLNADGKRDIVTDAPHGAVRVLLGNGSGGFHNALGSPFAARSAPSTLAIADMNGDRWPDVVAASASGGTVSILRGSSTGSLTLGAERTLGSRPASLTISDFNADGSNDVGVAEPDAGAVAVSLGDGAGNLNNGTTFAASSGSRAVASGDLNADGKPDLVAASDVSDDLTIALGDGIGGFTASSASPVAVSGAPYAVAVLDADRDGVDDVALARITRNDVVVERNTSLRGLAATPSAVDFGSQGVGTTSDETTIVASSDGLAYTITAITMDGDDFFVSDDGCTGRTIGDGYPTCEVKVRFAPSDVGERTGAVGFAHDGYDNVSVALTGAGIDIAAPETTISGHPSALTNDPAPMFTFDSDDPAASFECRIDGADFAPCSSPYSADDLADGTHTLDVRATDAAGNVDLSPASYSFTLDTTAPDTTILAGRGDPTRNDTPDFAFTADGAATFECRVDDEAFASCSSPYRTIALGDGAHMFEARATDGAGNTDATPAAFPFTVDTTSPDTQAPETTITEHPAELTNDTTPTFRFISDEPGATFRCAVDDAEFVVCGSPHTTDVLGEGSHVFNVAAVDDAGNIDPTPDSFAITIDVTLPHTTIQGPARSTRNNARFIFRFSENVQTVWCSMDGSGYSECRTPYSGRALRPGRHVLKVRAVDPAGNEGAPAVKRFTIVRRR